jgi:hypothetical protein
LGFDVAVCRNERGLDLHALISMAIAEKSISGTDYSMSFVKKGLVIFVIVDIAAALFFLPFLDWFVQFEEYVKSLGTLAPIAVAVVYVITTVLFIPGSALTIGSGTLFGLKTGFLVVLIGANVGAMHLPPGAYFPAPEGGKVGGRECQISLAGSSHRQTGIQDGRSFAP